MKVGAGIQEKCETHSTRKGILSLLHPILSSLLEVTAGSAHLSLLKRNLWFPVLALAGGAALLVHGIDLFKRQAFGLVDVEINKGDADEATPEPDEENLGL